MESLFTALAVTLLAAAAWRDVASRIIPNELCIGIAAAGISAQALQGPTALAIATAIAALLFAVLMIPFAAGALGGGDVKLAAALAVGLAPLDVWMFVTATAAAGGVLGAAYIMLWRAQAGRTVAARRGAWLPYRVLAIELHRIRRRGPLPYGVAIAAGGTFVLLAGAHA